MDGMKRPFLQLHISNYHKRLEKTPQPGVLTDGNLQPNMIEFNHSPDGVVLLSTSYYVHQLFSIYRGRTILDVQSNSAFGPSTFSMLPLLNPMRTLHTFHLKLIVFFPYFHLYIT